MKNPNIDYHEYDTISIALKKEALDKMLEYYGAFGWQVYERNEDAKYFDIAHVRLVRKHKIKNKPKQDSNKFKKDKKEIQEKIEFLETNLSNAFVLVASKSDDNAFKSLAYMTSIYCDSFKNIDAKILLNRYKALFECLSKTNKGEQVALSTLLYKLKNINIPNGIDYYTEIIGLHAEILKTLEKAAKEQND